MQFGPEEIVGTVAAVLTGAGVAWKVVQYILATQARGDAEVRKEATETSNAVRNEVSEAVARLEVKIDDTAKSTHTRIDSVREEYVRRTDYHRDFELLRQDLAGLREELRNYQQAIVHAITGRGDS